jgi:hypothetical protein
VALKSELVEDATSQVEDATSQGQNIATPGTPIKKKKIGRGGDGGRGGERKGKTQKIKHSIYAGRGPTHGPLSHIIAARIGYIPSQKSAKPNAPQSRVFNADRGLLRCGPASGRYSATPLAGGVTTTSTDTNLGGYAGRCWRPHSPARLIAWFQKLTSLFIPKDCTNPILPQVFPNKTFWFHFPYYR